MAASSGSQIWKGLMMKISYILSDKPKEYELIHAASSTPLTEIIDILSSKKIGAIVILDDDTLSGIISERDIVRILSVNSPDVLGQRVGNYMTKNVQCCHPEDQVTEVLERMSEGRFRHMPALQDGRLLGLVSIGDVTRIRVQETQREAEQMRQYIAAG